MEKLTSQRIWENIFKEVTHEAFSLLTKDELLNCNFSAEDTTFLRFNKSKVRQASEVEQADLGLELVVGQRRYSRSINLSKNTLMNKENIQKNLKEMQGIVRELPDDPYISPLENNGESHVVNGGEIPTSKEFLDFMEQSTSKVDLAGIYAAGDSHRANANSLGQRHWFSSTSFSFDYSLYTAKEKAVKGSYGGAVFKRDEFERSLAESTKALEVMDREQKVLSPGKYRCYLAPAAVQEIVDIMRWHGLSAGSYKRGECALSSLADKEKSLSPLFTMIEDFGLGLSPRFNERGEVFAEKLPLIEKGELKNLLVSGATEKEYGIKSNRASESESHRSAVILPGTLVRDDILKELGTGLYLSNLHYLNWSDKVKARITGMTRFGCLWVENGEIQGPIKDLRFDETLYQIFGEGLVNLTDFTQVNVETMTYGERHIGGTELPGILVDGMSFTL